MVTQSLERIYSALITPMKPDESIHYDILPELIERQLSDGVEGFYCCGSSGEGLLLSLEERMTFLERVLQIVDGRVPVIAHIGTVRTADVIALARHARDHGAAAVSMIPPYYYHFTMEEISAYYEAVVQAVPELGVIIYNVPQFSGIEFGKQNASRLLENPGIIGIKHTSCNLYSMERMHAAYPEKILFNGFDEQYLGALAMGCEATIGTTVNLYAPLFHKVRSCFRSGRLKEALAWQELINERVELMCRYGIFNAVKYIWTQRGIDCGTCRQPFSALSSQAMQELDAIVNIPELV